MNFRIYFEYCKKIVYLFNTLKSTKISIAIFYLILSLNFTKYVHYVVSS